MLKRYAETHLVWDTDTGKWFDPREQKIAITVAKPTVVENKSRVGSMGWRELLLHIYKAGRDGIGWQTVYDCHDEEDQAYFDMLDQQLRRSNGKPKC